MIRKILVCLVLAGLAGACAPQDRVLLLPGEDGTAVGAIAVLGKAGRTVSVIDTAYTEAMVSGETIASKPTDAETVRRKDGDLLDALPKAPSSYVLYFTEGTTTLVPASEAALQTLLKDAAERAGADVQVTGHTDTVGPQASNDALSLKRAEAIPEMLIGRGLAPELVRAVGRGERELLDQTEDGVSNARNRRVEVTVR